MTSMTSCTKRSMVDGLQTQPVQRPIQRLPADHRIPGLNRSRDHIGQVRVDGFDLPIILNKVSQGSEIVAAQKIDLQEDKNRICQARNATYLCGAALSCQSLKKHRAWERSPFFHSLPVPISRSAMIKFWPAFRGGVRGIREGSARSAFPSTEPVSH